MDKAAFIDRPADSNQEAVVVNAAPAIVDLLTPAVNFREIKIWAKGTQAEIDSIQRNANFIASLGNTAAQFAAASGLSESEIQRIQEGVARRVIEMIRNGSVGSFGSSTLPATPGSSGALADEVSSA